jgi:hypothetical protein
MKEAHQASLLRGRTRARWLVLAVAVVALAAAVTVTVAVRSSSPDAGQPASATGPLGTTDEVGSATECVPVRDASQAATITVDTFQVPHTRAPLVVDGVTFSSRRNLRVVGVVFVHHYAGGVGFIPGYPPPPEALDQVGLDWAHRQNAAGAQLRATSSDGYYDLVVGAGLVSSTPNSASFESMTIDYHVSKDRYTFSTPAGGLVVAKPRACPTA